MPPAHLPVLLALAGAPYEERLIAEILRSPGPIRIVRRCVDLSDLLAATAVGSARVAVVSGALARLDVDAVARIEAAGVRVVGIVERSDPGQSQRFRALGVADVVTAEPLPTGDLVASLAEVLSRAPGGPRAAAPPAADPSPEPAHGRIVAVWGPVGAPGRTTVATVVADELARLQVETLLIDADTYGPAVAQTWGILDEASGLAAAVRTARAGGIDAVGLARCALSLRPQLRVLTGVTRPDRWPELPAGALGLVLAAARALATRTVVDCGFCLEEDEELSFDTAAPRRNAAALVPLGVADVVLAVGSADPVGLARLVRALPELHDRAPQATVRVVVNQVRKAVVGRNPERRVLDNLARHAGVVDPTLVPYDREALDAALVAGRSLGDQARSSPVRAALARLAVEVADESCGSPIQTTDRKLS